MMEQRVILKEPKRYSDKYESRVCVKKCSKCAEIKNLDSFRKTWKSKDKLVSQCKTCESTLRKEYRKRDPEKTRQMDLKGHLKHQYGITPEIKLEMFKAQNGKCAICRLRRNLVIDHNHKTGKVRQHLCHPCNVLLGLAKDSIENLYKAAEYLKKHE